MEKTVDYYMGLPYRIELVPDGEGGYACRCPELPGCMTCAESREECLELIEDAKRSWFEACLEDGVNIPMPRELEEYSGQFKLRLPKSLHKSLAHRAAAEGVSMNQYCVYLLSHEA